MVQGLERQEGAVLTRSWQPSAGSSGLFFWIFLLIPFVCIFLHCVRLNHWCVFSAFQSYLIFSSSKFFPRHRHLSIICWRAHSHYIRLIMHSLWPLTTLVITEPQNRQCIEFSMKHICRKHVQMSRLAESILGNYDWNQHGTIVPKIWQHS